ncbi:MAG: tRNA (adenosine(37)-N6)-threonylcarbamoyltransferase complex dimerization subunit type 1 TsaB [Bryobacteraceae bacterium]|jgi:tRNA threonylcarbamoyladenosine biosynthesis protein TsaB
MLKASPLILALDTTRDDASLALARGNRILEEIGLASPAGFAHVVHNAIDALLSRHGLTIAAVDCFAAASGPGSFTGVRVGLACVKGLAEALAKPAVGVSSLEALATFGRAPLRAPVLDARRGQIYGAVYDASGRLVAQELVIAPAAWLPTLPTGVQFIRIEGQEPALPLPPHANVATAPRAQAAAVAMLALARLEAGTASDPAALDANYVRRSDAELFWTEPRMT